MPGDVSSKHVKRDVKDKRARAGSDRGANRQDKQSSTSTMQANSEIDGLGRIEEELEQSERDLAEAQRFARLGNWKWDLVNDEFNWSAEFFRILGYDPDSDVASNVAFLARVHPEDRASVEDRLAALASKGETCSVDHRIVLPDGSVKFLHCMARVEPGVDDKPARVFGIAQDISDRKQAEERYIRATEAGRVGVWDWDLKTDTIFVDPWLKNLLGYEDHEIQNDIDDWGSRVHPDDTDLVMAEATRHLDGVTDRYEVEHRMVHKDGSIVWFLARGTALRDDQGHAYRMTGTDTDITEYKQAREALLELGGRLINAQEDERSRIARELHDDVCQRIALLATELQFAAESFPESGPELSEKVGEVFLRLKELSADIHDLSYRLHPRSLERLGLTEALGTLCREIDGRRRIQLVFEETDMPDSMPDDAALCLYRVAQESLRNVVKHSRAERAEVELRGGHEEVRLTITDSGVGYDPDQVRERNGLGVISMRERLRALGGRLSIQSAPGEGTRVEAVVPIEDA
jgi:PAS domain S-box-containing protein